MVGHGVTISAGRSSGHFILPANTAVASSVMAAGVGVVSAQVSCIPTRAAPARPPRTGSVNPPSSGSIQR